MMSDHSSHSSEKDGTCTILSWQKLIKSQKGQFHAWHLFYQTFEILYIHVYLKLSLSCFYCIIDVENFTCSHAVDWIQDEGLVRVLVGKGGTIMFTLKMPPGYPFKGEITITNTSGLPANVYVEDCKVCYLLTWIKQSVNKTLL